MAANAPIRQIVSNGVMFFVPYVNESIKRHPQKKAPTVNARVPIPAPLLNMATTPVTCNIVQMSQV